MRHEIGTLHLALSIGPLLLLGGGAFAQATTPQTLANQPSRTYDVRNMNFDLWCQDTQQYPTDRCGKRLPADVKAFEDYRAAVERYELQYLKQVEQNRAAEERNYRDPTQTERARQDAPAR